MSLTKPIAADLDLSSARWVKSSASGGSDNCVELAAVGEFVALRDSKNADQEPKIFTRTEIAAFLAGAKAGEFDSLA